MQRYQNAIDSDIISNKFKLAGIQAEVLKSRLDYLLLSSVIARERKGEEVYRSVKESELRQVWDILFAVGFTDDPSKPLSTDVRYVVKQYLLWLPIEYVMPSDSRRTLVSPRTSMWRRSKRCYRKPTTTLRPRLT